MTAPVGSYRLQVTKDFTLYDAAHIVPYLRSLGISHLYLSPLMEARAGSNHGYDVTDMNSFSAERGGEEGFQALVDALGKDLRLILDIVPNHMAADMHNSYWHDVLKNGPESRYWHFFDIQPAKDGKIVLAVLSDTPENLWASGALALQKKDDAWFLAYADMLFPLCDNTPVSDRFSEIMQGQHYRLAKWDDDAYTYRRFFHLKELIGLRVEDPAVQRQTHSKLFHLLETCKAIAGLRVDHIDGLAEPDEYLTRLSNHAQHIWIEKILARGEKLRQRPVAGTTGYEFIDAVNCLFTHRNGYRHIETWWLRTIEPAWPNFEACLHEAKEEAVEKLFASALRMLASRFAKNEQEVEAAYRFFKDITVHMPVYRVYDCTKQDKKILLHALRKAESGEGKTLKRDNRRMLRRLLSGTEKEIYAAWQQLSGGIMAKGLEDRAHYRFTPLAALNEVGCIPHSVENGRGYYCDFVNHRSLEQPHGMNTTSTHDTKRSEDVRARLYALADMPLTWKKLYQDFCSATQTCNIPPATGYFFLQAAAGTWPLSGELPPDYCKRLQDYMEKSACEEARYTEYTDIDASYKQELRRFVAHVLVEPLFLRSMNEFMARLAPCGAVNALSVLTLKCLSPGLPDIYQGCEIWDFSLVDPDNRRAVDYTCRSRQLQALARRPAGAQMLRLLCRSWKSGLVKLWLTQKLLHIRRQYIAGQEISLQTVVVDGPYAENFHAYLLHAGTHILLVVHPLYPGRLDILRDGIRLPGHICAGISLRLPAYMSDKQGLDLISGETVHSCMISAQLERFPVAVSLFKTEGTFGSL